MEKTYLQWNIVNWITVLIMAVVGVTLFGAVASFVRQRMNPSEDK